MTKDLILNVSPMKVTAKPSKIQGNIVLVMVGIEFGDDLSRPIDRVVFFSSYDDLCVDDFIPTDQGNEVKISGLPCVADNDRDILWLYGSIVDLRNQKILNTSFDLGLLDLPWATVFNRSRVNIDLNGIFCFTDNDQYIFIANSLSKTTPIEYITGVEIVPGQHIDSLLGMTKHSPECMEGFIGITILNFKSSTIAHYGLVEMINFDIRTRLCLN